MGLAEGTGKGGMGSRLAPAASPGSTRSLLRLAFWSCLGRPRIKSGEAVCGDVDGDWGSVSGPTMET